MPAKGRIEWPYVALLIGIVLMIAAAAHLLSAWVAFVIFGALGVFVMLVPNPPMISMTREVQ